MTDLTYSQSGTLCIAVNSGFSVRYLLQTDVLPRLLNQGAKVVVVTLSSEVDAVKAVISDTIDVLPVPTTRHLGRLTRYLILLRSFLRARYVSTAREMFLRARAEAPSARMRMTVTLIYVVARMLTVSRVFRKAVPWVEARLSDTADFQSLLQKIAPDVLILTSHGAVGFDREIAFAAKKCAIPITTVVQSWDNVTSHCYPAYFADHVAAWTETMKNEIVELLDYPPDRVTVCGVAHFSVYHRPDPDYEREEVLQSFNLDPAKKTIVLATKSPNSYPWNPNVIVTLANAIDEDRLPDCQLIVRIHPIHYRKNDDGALVYDAALACYRQLAETYPQIVLSEPGLTKDSTRFAMAEREMRAVCRLLRASDVLVNFFSTMNIEGALLDKPLINVCYDAEQPMYDFVVKPRFDIFSDARESHNQRIIDSGGTAIAYTPSQLIDHVVTALADPSRYSSGRDTIRSREGGPYKGNAGAVLADFLLRTANRNDLSTA